MNRRLRPAVAVVILSLVCLACGGGKGGGNGPTEPPEPSGKRLVFTAAASPAALGSGAMLEAAVFLDGREIGRMDWSRAGGSCTILCGINGDVQGISPGDHTVRYTVVRQDRTVADFVFVLSGVITDPATGSRQPFNAPAQRLRVRAGESVTFTVRI